VSDLGQKISFEVTSNIYWTIEVDPSDDWLAVSPIAGYGKTTVNVAVSPNLGDARVARLTVVAADGKRAEVVVEQGAAGTSIVYIADDYDGSALEEDMPAGLYHGWNKHGTDYNWVSYASTGAVVSSQNPSTGYQGASGGNNILLPLTGDTFQMNGIRPDGAPSYILNFGYTLPADATQIPVKVRITYNDKLWRELSPEIVSTGGGWGLASVEFRLEEVVNNIKVQLVSLVDGVRIDDFAFFEGTGGGDLVVLTSTILFSEDFSWLNSDNGYNCGQDYFAPGSIGATGTRMDSWPAPWLAQGWTTDATQFNNVADPAVYAFPGYVRLGRTNVGAGVISPDLQTKTGLNLQYSLVTVTFKCASYQAVSGTFDPENRIAVSATNCGALSNTEFVVENAREWATFSFTIADFTPMTKIVFRTFSKDVTNRLELDDVVVSTLVEGTPWTAPPETILFTENFDWIDATSGVDGGSDYFQPSTGATGARFDTWPAAWVAKGYTTAPSMFNNTGEYTVYARPGYVQLGKTNVGGGIITPTLQSKTGLALQYSSVTVRFDCSSYASMSGTRDAGRYVSVTAVNGATITPLGEILVDNYRQMENFSVTIPNFTPKTQIAFHTKEKALSNRLLLDNIVIATIVAGTPWTDPTAPVGLPVEWSLPSGVTAAMAVADGFAGYVNTGGATNPGNNAPWCYADNFYPAKSTAGVALMEIIQQRQGGTNPGLMSYTRDAAGALEDRLLIYGMGLDDYWKFTVPVKNFTAGTVNIKGTGNNSATGPKLWVVEYSLTGNAGDWTAAPGTTTGTFGFTSGNFVSLPARTVAYHFGAPNTTVAATYTIDVDIPIAQDIADGNIYIRIKVAGDMAINEQGYIGHDPAILALGNASIGGTSRLTRNTAITDPIIAITRKP
jgi:hypothetical protein